MDYLELQQRANVLVDKVNEYEANQAKYIIKEDDYLNEHKYVDLFTLRAVLNLLFGKTVAERADRTLSIPTSLRMFASTAPAWNSDFSITEKGAGNEKLEYILNPKISLVGNPIMDISGIASGFTNTDYYTLESPILNIGDSTTLHVKLQYNGNVMSTVPFQDVRNNIYIFWQSAYSRWCAWSGKDTYLSNSGSSLVNRNVDIIFDVTTTKTAESSYSLVAKVTYPSGTVVTTNYTFNTPEIPTGHINIGSSGGVNSFVNGSIYMHESYYRVNNEDPVYFAIPNIDLSTAEIEYNCSEVGTELVKDNGVVSNFTTSSYLTFDQPLQAGAKIEKCYYFRSVYQAGALAQIDHSLGTELYIENNKVAIFAASTGRQYLCDSTSSYQVAESSCWWRVKLTYYIPEDLATKDIDCTYDVKCLNTDNLYSSGTAKIQFEAGYSNIIGNWDKYNHDRPFKKRDYNTGYIDLNYSYYRINNEDPIYFCNIKSPTGEIGHGMSTIKHILSSNIDVLNSTNMITLDSNINTLNDKKTRVKSGINYSYSSNIADALVTESQTANIFKWNTTTSDDIPNNTISSNRQVPGIVCYYAGSDIDLNYTSTIPYNPTQTSINAVNYGTPATYGGYYSKGSFDGGTYPYGAKYSQYSKSYLTSSSDKQALRLFMTGLNYTRGKLESPQQIWQPDEKYGDDNLNYGFNRQGQAVYHELVFKNRRSGSKDAGVDFISGLDSIPDNDPQGLAMRIALAQQKDYFKNRHWWSELNDVYKADMTKFADSIIEASIEQEATEEHDAIYMTDTEFMNSYKLPYSLYADCFNQPL